MRAMITGLVSFAAAEEQALLLSSASVAASVAASAAEGPDNWAAVPLVAHCNHFKQQQAQRVWALVRSHPIPSFGEVDHRSESVYAGYAAAGPDEVLAENRRVTADLIDAVWALPSASLRDAQVNGRMLWLQLVVRGFWHSAGHLGDYYLGHEQADRAVALAAHGVATARYLSAPDPAVGMACYNLACALSRAGQVPAASGALAEAIALNPELSGNASRDPDLRGVTPGGGDGPAR